MIPITEIVARLRSRGLMLAADPEIDLEVTGITDDSRQVKPGDLYCAIRGYADDGHRYLRSAAEAGATASLVEFEEHELDLLQIRVASTRRAAAIAAQVVYGDPADELKLVGVTGTNGKTTTVQLARHILGRAQPSASIGTLGVVAASGQWTTTELTTPGPIDFARQLAELRKDGAEIVVAEVSSHALTQERVSAVTFDVGVFTNLTRDHLDYHTDFDDYRAAKARLLELLESDGVLVVNADETAWGTLEWQGRRSSFGVREQADYAATDLRFGPGGSSWRLTTPDGAADVDLPLLGEFNVSNALGAAAVAGAVGLDVEMVAAALSSAPPIPGRLEVLAREPLVIRDYAHTPDALRRALDALRPYVTGQLIVVFGCGGDRDRGKRELMGAAAAEGADYSFVTSDNPRTEVPETIIAEIVPGLGEAPHEQIVDRRAAIERAFQFAGPADAVLLAGKGHETYQVVGDERRPFDEAVIVQELLPGNG